MLFIKINFYLERPDQFQIESNIKQEMIPDVLAEFIRSQAGKGPDERPSRDQAEYKITLKLDLNTDTFYLSSDTGNDALALGIISHIYNKLAA
jgi:hypothetical protein